MNKNVSILALHIAGISGRKFSFLQKKFGSVYDFFSASSKEVSNFLRLIDLHEGYISREYLLDRAYRDLERWKDWHIYCVSIGDELYPPSLLQITNPPRFVFLRTMQWETYKKEIDSCTKKWVAVVGTRNSDSFSNQIAQDVARVLAQKNVIVVSGMAKGIDTHAHIGAMGGESGVCTVAVFGCGVLYVYPKSNTDVYRKIIESGNVVLSEYLPEEKPAKYYFPMRNRVMAGLSDAVIVIQAPSKSGVRITVNFALDMGKDVYVYKPKARTTEYELNFTLIDDGARWFSSKEELLELFFLSENLESKIENSSSAIPVNSRDILFQILESGPVQMEDLCKQMNASENEIVPLLMRYLISGDVIEMSGNRFYRSVY